MSAWKSTPLLPTLFLSSTFASFAPARKTSAVIGFPLLTLDKADVYGFWSMDMGYGPDIHVTVESFCMQDGSYETRTYLETEDGIERLHGFGAWIVRGNAVVTMPSPTHCKSLGDLTEGCSDSSSESVAVASRADGKVMFLDTGTEVGRYVSPLKRFTLPDLFASGLGHQGIGEDWQGAAEPDTAGCADFRSGR